MNKILLLASVLVLVASNAANAAKVSLVDAVKDGDRTTVRQLIDGRTDVNVPEADGMTALHWAVYNDRVEIVEMLLRAGANANARSRTGATPLELASENGNAAIVERLIQSKADPNLVAAGETPLHMAAYAGHVAAAKILIANGAKVDAREAWYAETPLMLAASQRHSEMVEYLIRSGADVNAMTAVTDLLIGPGDQNSSYTQTPRGGLTPLLFAARDGCSQCAELLVAAGAKMNYEDPAWVTPLNLAVYNGHLDLAAFLLEHGASANDDSLYLAVELRNLPRGGGGQARPNPKVQGKWDHLGVIRLLLDKGASPNCVLTREIQSRTNSFQRVSSITGLTALQRAAQALDLEVMRLLLARGADTNQVTMQPEADLDAASGWGGHLALLSVTGAVGGRGGRDLAYRSVEASDQLEAMKLLLDGGADINRADFAGMTALHLAAQNGSNPLVEFLVDHGAKMDLRDFWDRTPLDVAAGGGREGLDGFAAPRAARPETQALLRRLMGIGTDPPVAGGSKP